MWTFFPLILKRITRPTFSQFLKLITYPFQHYENSHDVPPPRRNVPPPRRNEPPPRQNVPPPRQNVAPQAAHNEPAALATGPQPRTASQTRNEAAALSQATGPRRNEAAPLLAAAPPASPDRGDREADDDDDDEDEENSFESLFLSFSNQWLHTQLTHHVSLAASNDFWKLSFKYVSKILEFKFNEGVKSKIPQFLQIRKNIHRNICPDIRMNFVFLNKTDNSLVRVNVDHTPVKEYERNPQYQKLYEEAHIQVKGLNYFGRSHRIPLLLFFCIIWEEIIKCKFYFFL